MKFAGALSRTYSGRVLGAALFAGLVCLNGALATVVSIEASANATVKPAGPRSGTSGTSFFNVEGSGNAANASYGTTDFLISSLSFGGPISDITSFSFSLVESNAAFTAPGTIEFYLASDATTAITPGATTPAYVSGQDSAASVGSALGTLTLLGTGAFTTTGNVNSGQVDTFNLTSTLPASAKQAIIDAVNAGSTFRLVLTSGASTPGLGGTFAGSTNTTLAGPTLTIDAVVVPEPTSLALLGFGAGLATMGRRRKC